MKTKRTFIPVFTLSVALLLTACNGKEAADTKKTQTTQTESGTEAVTGSVAESGTETAGASGTKLDDLYQQENQIFADHADVWNKVFGMMNKSTADPGGNYADYLADTVEANKDSFSEDELKTLTDDIETIRKIEEQIAEMENGNTASEDSDAKNDSEEASPFRDFSGQDYDGNTVDESLFSKNAVTVVNFWFTGCKPCVAELSKLNELNDAIKSMGGEVVGINTETFDGNQDAIKEAAAVLKSQGAKYRNLSIDSASAAGKYASDIMAFPTTILVDRNGNIVGEPMLGGIDNQENYDTLMKQIHDGNTVDESLFSKNAVTVVNFWFTGCKPCVAELSKLNELNDAIKSMGGEVVGINTETFDGNQDAIKEAAAVLKSQGAKYRNLSIDSASAAGKYASDIMAFPTTILVDRNGNIVGEPMLGGIDNQENYDTLMKQIQSVMDADSAK